MRTVSQLWSRSYRRAGRLMPPTARGLRARAVVLVPGGGVEWHSTGQREELLIVLRGQVTVEVQAAARCRQRRLRAGACAFVPMATTHRVVNRSQSPAHYLYVTAPTSQL